MDQNTAFLYMLIRDAQGDTSKSARRRERLLRLEREAREARSRRRRERLRAGWNRLIATNAWTGSRRNGIPDLGKGLR